MNVSLLVEQGLNGIQLGMVLFLMSAGLTLIFGVMGLLNLAHGSFYMIGAFACAGVTAATGSFWLGLVASLVVAWLLGAVVEVTVIRRLYKRDHFEQALATFALILILSEGTRAIFGPFPLYLNIPPALASAIELPGGIEYPTYRFALIVVGMVLAVTLYWLIDHTRLGARIRAGQSDREMVAALGVNINMLYTVVFALGTCLAGIGGALIGALQSVEVGMGEPMLILAFVVIVIAGMGSILGAMICAVLVGIVDTLGRYLLPLGFSALIGPQYGIVVGATIASLIIYLFMSLVLVFRPKGLLGGRR